MRPRKRKGGAAAVAALRPIGSSGGGDGGQPPLKKRREIAPRCAMALADWVSDWEAPRGLSAWHLSCALRGWRARRRMNKAQRCGVCRHCLNPSFHQACLARRAEQQAAL